MRRETLGYLLALSVLFNLGALAAAGYQSLRSEQQTTDIPKVLALDAGQARRWKELDAAFVSELDSGWREIGHQRETLIRAVFADQPDPNAIEATRARIAELQANQQRRVIAQLLQEKQLLAPAQREALMKLLLRQRPPTPDERQLHGD